jgi:nicotinamidase-related amidase
LEITINLEYTPRSPRQGIRYTESSFVRSSTTYTFQANEIGAALVDLWNFGWDDGPVADPLDWELSTERGVSHALRKREIIVQRIAPAVNQLRQLGIQIFHCNHASFLQNFPQWIISTTEEERKKALDPRLIKEDAMVEKSPFPELEWRKSWMTRHSDDVFNLSWSSQQAEVYDQIVVPKEVEPQGKDILIYSKEQFHRNLRNKRIRVLFYMGFETDECVMNSDYGIINMHSFGYMTNIVRDCTTTYESAETFEGFWRTKVAIEQIEKRWGYSINSFDLLNAFDH